MGKTTFLAFGGTEASTLALCILFKVYTGVPLLDQNEFRIILKYGVEFSEGLLSAGSHNFLHGNHAATGLL